MGCVRVHFADEVLRFLDYVLFEFGGKKWGTDQRVHGVIQRARFPEGELCDDGNGMDWGTQVYDKETCVDCFAVPF